MGLSLAEDGRQGRVVRAVTMHPNVDGIRPLRWGWIAVACELETDQWLRAPEAAEISGLDTGTLRRLVKAGLVTAIQWRPREHYSYLLTEMHVISRLTKEVDGCEKVTRLEEMLCRALEG